MKNAFDSCEEEDINVGQGDGSGTGLDLLDEILASCWLIGESDFDAAAAKAKAEMEAHRRWLLSGERIQYLGVIIKGRAGVQVKGPVTLTRFTGTIDPKYADGIVEVVRLNAAGEHQNVLLRCALRRLGLEGLSICERYKKIGQMLAVKIAPNDLGGFNLDVAVSSEEIAKAVGGGSPVSNGSGSKRTRATRASGAAAGGNFLNIPPSAWPSTSSIPKYVMGAVLCIAVASTLLVKAFSSTKLESPSLAAENGGISGFTTARESDNSQIEQKSNSEASQTGPSASTSAPARERKTNRVPLVSPTPTKISDTRLDNKGGEKLASVDQIVIVISPKGKNDREITDIREAFATDLKEYGFTKDDEQTKTNVLVMRKKSAETSESRTVLINVTDNVDEEDDCSAQTNAQEQAMRLQPSEFFDGDLSTTFSTVKGQCIDEAPQAEPIKVDLPKPPTQTD